MNFFRIILALLVLFALAGETRAQVVPLVARVNVPPATEKQPLSIGVELASASGISRVLFKFRQFGESEFRELEMFHSGRTATVTLPAEYVLPPSVEYYIQVFLEDGRVETFPLQSPEASPQKIAVKESNPKDLEVRILSPEAGERVTLEELVIAVSLFYAGDDVNRDATQLYLDGVNVTRDAVFSDDMVLYAPRNFPRPLSLGAHFIKVELFDTRGQLYHRVESSFNLSTASAVAAARASVQALFGGQLEFRNEQFGRQDTSVTYARGDLRLSGSYGGLRFGGSTHITNQEKDTRQPQNRLLLFGQTEFLRLQYGDLYPRFPSYLVSGKRVRGFGANLTLGFFNVDVAYGKTARSVEGIYLRDTTFASDREASQRPSNTYHKSGLTYELFQRGTYERDFFAVRPSFGKGENFQLGFTYLKAKDNVGSIRYGLQPQENLVVGSDLTIAFDNQRFKFETQASLGVTNTDISGGNFTKADYDSLRARDPKTADDIERIANIAEKFITVNGNINPTNPFGEGLPALAYEATLSLNYFNNLLQATLFRRGAAYSSFGNEFLQTDIAGFFLSDRIRMFSNRAFLTLTYERRNDNTANNKLGTMTINNLNALLTVVPANLPSLSFGYGVSNQESDVPATHPATQQRVNSVDNSTSRLFAAANYDFVAGARHALSVTMSLASRTDNTFFGRDQTNLNLQCNLFTTFRFPLQTTLTYTLSNNKNEAQLFTTAGRDSVVSVTEFNFSTVTAGLQYRLLDERLRLTTLISPTFGAFSRTTFRGGLDYTFPNRHAIELYFDFIQNAGDKDDTIASLVYRFNF